MTAMTVTYVADFSKDWMQIMREALKALGITHDPNLVDDQLSLTFWNARLRFVGLVPRTVHLAKEFQCPPASQADLDALTTKFETGDDVNPHFSNERLDTKKANFNDGLFNDWRIQHFHLGKDGKRGGDWLDEAGRLKVRLDTYVAAIDTLDPLRGLPIENLDLGGARISDLEPLRGMPLQSLVLGGTKVTDLAPLAGMPLVSLRLDSTPVEDLSPLKGLPLAELNLNGSKVRSLAPLAGMPLRSINVARTPVRDLAVVGPWACRLRALLAPLPRRARAAPARRRARDLASAPRRQGDRATRIDAAHRHRWRGWDRSAPCDAPHREASAKNRRPRRAFAQLSSAGEGSFEAKARSKTV